MPAVTKYPATFVPQNRAGRMLAQGRLTVTVRSKRSGEHVTLKFSAKAQIDGRWKFVSFDKATRIFINDEHDRYYSVGTLYRHTDGMAVYLNSHADIARHWSALATLNYIFNGVVHPQAEISERDACGRCGRPLTDPESITRGIGPECYGKITGSHVAPKRPREDVIA